jgi:hypothetical protein
MPDRLIGLERAEIDHLLDHRMVLRHLPNLAPAKEVGAAVAHVRDLRASCMNQRGHAGGAGAPRLRTHAAHLVHEAAGLRDGGAKRDAWRRAGRRTLHHLHDRSERELARLLSERVTSHPVAHHEEVAEPRGLVSDRVLVDLLVRVAPGVRPLSDFEVGS